MKHTKNILIPINPNSLIHSTNYVQYYMSCSSKDTESKTLCSFLQKKTQLDFRSSQSGVISKSYEKSIQTSLLSFRIDKYKTFHQNSIKQHLSAVNVLQSYYFGITRQGIAQEQIENRLYIHTKILIFFFFSFTSKKTILRFFAVDPVQFLLLS